MDDGPQARERLRVEGRPRRGCRPELAAMLAAPAAVASEIPSPVRGDKPNGEAGVADGAEATAGQARRQRRRNCLAETAAGKL